MRDLRDKYGGSKRSTMNRAIRGECPGGAEALDTVTVWYNICNRLGWGDRNADGTEALHVAAYKHLLTIVGAMEREICTRYDIQTRQHDDLER